MIKVIFLLTTVLCTLAAKAQTAKSTATATTSNTQKDGRQTAHSSVSVSKSDNAYSLRADFDPDAYPKLKEVLEKNLEKEYRTAYGKMLKWIKEENNETAYSFILTEDKLKINIDKDMMSDGTFEKLSQLGDRLSVVISGGSR